MRFESENMSNYLQNQIGLMLYLLVAQPTKKNKVLWKQSGEKRNDKSGFISKLKKKIGSWQNQRPELYLKYHRTLNWKLSYKSLSVQILSFNR